MTEVEAVRMLARKPITFSALASRWHDGLVDFVMMRGRLPNTIEADRLRTLSRSQRVTEERTARRERLRLELEL